MNKKQMRIALLGVSSILLIAIGALIGNKNTYGHDNDPHIPVSSKLVIKKLCHNDDHEDECINNLWSKKHKTDERKELINLGFEAAIRHMKAASHKATLLLKHHNDFRTKGALESCNELSDMAIFDIHRTFSKFADLDVGSTNKVLKIADLKIWISGAMTYQETCLDGFIKTSGNVGEKMRDALKSGMKLTAHALGMLSEIASVFAQTNIIATTRGHRHLLTSAGYPDWLDSTRRNLMEENSKKIEPNLTVAKDGSGDFKTINEALEKIPKNSDKRFVLYIKEGVYEEKVQFNATMAHLMVVGDGPTKTKITGKLNRVDGTPTFHSATVAVHADYFVAKDMGFENTAGPEKEQAVALRVSADKSIFYNCQMDGYQDTLYTHTYRQFYRDCTVSGTIDFIFGDGAAVFQNCTLLIRKPLDNQQNIVTAQGRKDQHQPTGLVLQNCTFTADSTLSPVKDKFKSYLARPWKEYSRTIFLESYIDDVIRPEGYLKWNDTFALDTLFYTEFNNRGPRANKDKREKWPGIKELNTERILRFTPGQFIEVESWIPWMVPYAPALVYSPPDHYPAPISPETELENADLNNPKEKQAYVAPKAPAAPPKPEAPAYAPTDAPSYAPTGAPAPADYAPSEAPDSAPHQEPDDIPLEEELKELNLVPIF